MKHEIVIRGGEIVDGTGAEPFAGDLAIDDGRITEIGKVEGRGAREIDARGHLVTPGFVDLHTHLDAQIGWDPLMTPVSWHGVTTALMGNCGVTFAPCRPDDRELLASMMETVEDIPKDAILGGLPWDWEGYGGYLDSIERLQPAVNVCGLVGHCAVRFYVMGERAVEEQATEEELEAMAESLHVGLYQRTSFRVGLLRGTSSRCSSAEESRTQREAFVPTAHTFLRSTESQKDRTSHGMHTMCHPEAVFYSYAHVTQM